MQDTEWEDVVVSSDIADTEWEDVNPVTQSVLDNRDGKVYNVPLAMDGIDAEFAIDTQHKGANKGSFFGKVLSAGESVEELFRSAEKGIVRHAGDIADTFLAKGYRYKDKVALLKQAEKGDFSYWGDNLSEEEKRSILEERRQKVKWVEDLRAKNKAFWGKTAEALRPEEQMDEMDKVFEGLGGAAVSVGESVLMTMATKNPTVAAATIGTLYGAISDTQYFDKAMEAGADVDEAIENAKVAGYLEGGIEFVGDRLLLGVSKLSSIQKISNRVVSSSIVKAAQSTLGKSAIKKIGTRHANSIFGTAVKGGLSEAGTEGLQTLSGMSWENFTDVSDYSGDEILNQTLFSAVIGGIVGAGTSTVGGSIYNRMTVDTNNKIKAVLKEQTPELTKEETQVMADAIQEMLYQESTSYINEMNKVVEKEKQPDVMPEGLTPEKLTAETRKLLKEKYKMSDEDINKTIQASLGIIDARNQFNEAYSIFNEGLTNAGRLAPVADAEARILAARALSVARAEGTQVKDVLDRWNLQFRQTAWNEGDVDNALEQAMYKSKLETIEQFVDDVFNSKDTSARYFTITSNSGVDFDLPRDTVLHDKKHNLSSSEWKELTENIDNFESVSWSDKSIYNGQSVLLKVKAPSGKYGVVFEHMAKGRNIITTVFKDTDANIDNWIKNNSARAMRKASTTQKGLLSSRSIADIISNLDNDVNSLLQQRALFQESLDVASQNAEFDANNPAYEGETINIDGVERAVYNSNGDRIAMSEPALRNFYKWFGDSKVVDKEGRPLVVYHGTNAEFDTFDKSKQKRSLYGKGFYFTDTIEWAKQFISPISWKNIKDNDKRVMPLYLSMKKPYITDKMNNDAQELQEQGYDGIIVKNYDTKYLVDNPDADIETAPVKDTTYIAFEPNQIKSTSNRGTYSESDNIYFQSAFHGTPHAELEGGHFSLEKMGSGEGFQAHGYGLYYAASYDVADKSYRQRLVGRTYKGIPWDETPIANYNISISNALLLGRKDKVIQNFENTLKKAQNQYDYLMEEDTKGMSRKDKQFHKESIEYAKNKIERYTEILEFVREFDINEVKSEGGQVYEVDLPENPYLLDEEKLINNQDEHIRKAVRNIMNSFPDSYIEGDDISNFGGLTGETFYRALMNIGARQGVEGIKAQQKFASETLEKHGIKGITYEGGQDGRCFVIFNPDDVKVIQKFYQDETNPSGPRGAYKNGIIYLFENADASTVIHELGHFFLDDMQKFADNETTKGQLEAIYKFVGSTDGKLTREQHEYFANAFELYLLDGRAPNKVLEGVFVRFRKWLSRMWSEIKRISYVKLTPEIRKTFDQMLGGRGLDFAMQMSGARIAEALESGAIPSHVVDRAIKLLDEGKMSRSDMDDLLAKLKSGELKRKDFAQELKKFESGNVKHNEALNPFDKLKYKEALSRGNFSKRDVLEKINRLLKWSEPRSQNGKLVGRFSNLKMNQQFDHIRELMAMDKAQAKEKIAENVALINAIIKGEEVGDTGKIAFDNKILSIAAGKANASLLVDVYNAISDSYNLGRLTTAVTGEAKKARTARMIQETKDVLTNEGKVNWRKEQSKIKQFINQLGTSQMSWQGILDILSMNDTTSKTGQSKLNEELDVFEAQQKEAQGVADDGEKASKFMEKHLGGPDNAAISVSRYVNSKLQEKFVIEWDGNKRTFTKDQLLDIYMKSKDQETRTMMAEDKILQYNDNFLMEVNQVLTAEDRAITDALFEFYDDNYAKINAFYEDKYGTSLGKRAYYSPRSMDRGGINVDTGDLASYAGFSGVKQRKAKAGAVKIKGAFQVLQDYIINSNHWIAWSDKLIDINAVMGDVEVKNIIRNLFGEGMEKRIGYEVSRMASNDKFQKSWFSVNWVKKVRSNYAIAALAAKPSLMIKQLTSFPAYWEHMSTAEFMSGLADFAANMKEAVETLGNTTLMKTRDVNIIKDFEELSKSELFKSGSTKVKLREFMMANIKLGDRGAIYMGGWALYKAELKKNLAKGMDAEKAKALALEKFERVTDETQQSGRLSQQSYWQSNPFLRMFTMFQSSQNQYLRKEINAIRGLATGRMDAKQAAKTLFIFHILLPCFFQFASDGFDWDKKAQLRAALLGSLNGIFILNNILERGVDIVLGTADAWRATSVGLSDVLPFWGSGEDLAKFFIDLAEGDVDLEDYVEVIRAFGKPAGELFGIPVKYPLDVYKNFGSYAEEGEYKKELLLWLGWSPYALRDKSEE